MQECCNFNHLKAKETEIQSLFALRMDNETGKETAMLKKDTL